MIIKDKNNKELIFGATYKVPRSEIKFKLVQRGEALFLQEFYTNKEFPIENFIAEDKGEKFVNIYSV